MTSYYLTEEQDNSTIQSRHDPKVVDICTPQNIQDKIDTTKETYQTITLTYAKRLFLNFCKLYRKKPVSRYFLIRLHIGILQPF